MAAVSSKFAYDGNFDDIIDSIGEMPLPPYIHEKMEDPNQYQTVYANERGSAAAPTAGLHFTEELLQKIRDKGVEEVFITLHVGLGTFRPVEEENIEDHEMHSEFYSITEEAAATINKAKAEGRRVIAVGTTSIRTLESAGTTGTLKAGSGWTNIFIYPGFTFHIVDALVTNFHLPESTLLMLISALSTREKILKAYETAVKENTVSSVLAMPCSFTRRNLWLLPTNNRPNATAPVPEFCVRLTVRSRRPCSCLSVRRRRSRR